MQLQMFDKEKPPSDYILGFVFLLVVLYFVFLQFVSPVLYEVDGYYHIAVSNFIKVQGAHYQFHWAQVSTFKNYYSDKDLLFHLTLIPFLYLWDNLIVAGKIAVIFYNIVFFLVYLYVLKKYLPNFLVACLLILPVLSSNFCVYSLWLRPAVLANILTLLSVYFIINKRWFWLLIVSVLYPLTHLSFYMGIIFAVIAEIIRKLANREFCVRNIYAVLLGNLVGLLIHPNFPNNLLSFYLNGILVPFYAFAGSNIILGREFYSSSAKFIFTQNFNIFITLNIVLLILFFRKFKLNFPTFVWWSCTNIYLAFSFISDRHFYTTNVLCFIFFASFLNDWLAKSEWSQVLKKLRIFIGLYVAAILLFFPANIKVLAANIKKDSMINTHYENVAKWMRRNIPIGQTIFHAYGSDSSYFICLNPKNNYLYFLDPIYMFTYNPEAYVLYLRLREGSVLKPFELIRGLYKSDYGYTRKELPLFKQISSDSKNFKILYEDEFGIVFKIVN